MSQAITHFAVGATLTALAVTLVPTVRYPRTLVLVGGGWALVPDAAKLLSRPTLRGLHDSQLADLFWFHRTLDRADPTDSTVVASAAVAAFIVVTAVLEWRSYRTPKNVADRFGD